MDRLPLEVEEIAEMEFDFIAELMEEPPHGHNHGRKKTAGGRSVSIETDLYQAIEDHLSIEEWKPKKTRSRKPGATIRHGTMAGYNHDRCRCDRCRRALADYRRWKRLDVQP